VAERWERLAEEIRALSGRRRVSLAEVCRRTEMSRTGFYRRLGGDTPWTYDELKKVAKALEVSMNDLLRMADIDPATAWKPGDVELAPNGKSP